MHISFLTIVQLFLRFSVRSPGTPKETLRNRIHDLMEEYSELRDFTTLEKQLYFEDHDSKLKDELARLSMLEQEMTNVTSDKDAFEHIASDLRKKLTVAELRYTTAEDQLNTQSQNLRKISDLEKRIEQLSAQEMEARIIPVLRKQISLLTAEKDGYEHVASELRKKLNESDQRNVLLEEKLATQNGGTQIVQTSSESEDGQSGLATRIAAVTSEKDELQTKVIELQKKLAEAESCNNSMKDQLHEQHSKLQNLQDLKTRVESLTSEKEALECTVCEMQDKLREIQEIDKEEFKLAAGELRKKGPSEAGVEVADAMKDRADQQDAARRETELEIDLKNKVRELELTNGSLESKLIEQEEKTRDLEKQVEGLTIERNKFEGAVIEFKEKSREAELMNNLLEEKLNEAGARKIDDIEVSNKNASENTKLEHVIGELEGKLKQTELRNNSIEEELSLQRIETQKAIDEQRRCAESFALERSKLEEAVREWREKSLETDVRNNLMQNRIDEQESRLQKSHDLEREIESLTSRTVEFECTIRELQEKQVKIERDGLPKDQPCEEQLQGEDSRIDRNGDDADHLKDRINDTQTMTENTEKENVRLKEGDRSIRSTISDHEDDLSNGDSRIIEDLSSSRISLEEDSARLSMDLLLKNRELDEIKHDVQGLKTDIVNLQQTIYLLTTENSDLANKLSAEKEYFERSSTDLQQTIEELYARNSKIMDEKLNAENNLAMLSEQMEGLRSRIPDANLNEKQIVLKYEEQLNALTARNTELLCTVADTMKELETLKESKSLLYEHDCMYKDKLTNLTEKYNCLTTEYNDLSTELMDRIEENDSLRQERDILQSKLDLSLRSQENVDDKDAEQLMTENMLLKTELVELKINLKTLTEENSKMSSQLVDTIEEVDNARKINSCSDTTLHLSTLFNDTSIMNDTIRDDRSTRDTNADPETRIRNLQEEVNHLTHLNRKLSDLKLSACTECTHLKELNESQRMLKLQVKSFSNKLEDLQRKFDCKSARSDVLISKAKEDINLSSSSLNASFSENLNVTCVEDRLQVLSGELQGLKEEYNKLSELYKEKCNEIEELQNSSVADATTHDNPNLSVKRSPNRTLLRLENVVKVMNDLQSDFEKIKGNNVSVRTDLSKFTKERDHLLGEINSLRSANEELLQKLSENEYSYKSALENAEILEGEIADLTKKLQERTVKYKEMENAKLLLEIDVESLKEDKALKDRTITELRQSLSCLQHELDVTVEQRKKLDCDNNSLEQKYEKKLEVLKAKNEELLEAKASVEQKLADHSRESEDRLTELNDKINRYSSENDYLKQELMKLRNIEDKYEKMRNEYQSRTQQDKTLVDDNKKLKNMLNNTSRRIIQEIKALKPKMDIQAFQDKSVDELFQIFLQTILTKEKEIVRTMREDFDREKQRLEDEKQQSVDSKKRTTLWAKELEGEIEKLQGDLSAREATIDSLQKDVTRVQQLLEENNHDRETLREKISLLEADFNNVQTELKKYSKIDSENGEAVVIAQKREKQAQEIIRSKEAEFQLKLKSEKETYNTRIEELACKIDSFRTKNMELTSNIEGLEANQMQLRNIVDLKTNELMKTNQIIQKIQTDFEQLTEAYNELSQELEEKNLRVAEMTQQLKTKSDELTEYKTNLEIIMPENELLKRQINERKASIEQYKNEIQTLKMENTQELYRLKDQLSFEELKVVELSKQIAELNNKNVALTEQIDVLNEKHVTLERKRASLERRVRNSTSKSQAEEQMEELKDLNKSLRNNLDGASNRITELQTAKTNLMKQLVTLNSQHDATCKENQELKETLSSYRSKHDDEKCNALIQEKNKIALELEASKFQLRQKNKELEGYADKIKELTEKNKELDREAEDLAEVIREHDGENARLHNQLFNCHAHIDALNKKIEELERRNPEIQTRCTQKTDPPVERIARPHDDECSCTVLNNKIRELQLEIVSKNGKIATLELQIRSGSYPYQEKCKELQEYLLAHRNKART